MLEERIIDWTNDYFTELVINTDTGEIVRDIELSLSEHTGRGYAKFTKQQKRSQGDERQVLTKKEVHG